MSIHTVYVILLLEVQCEVSEVRDDLGCCDVPPLCYIHTYTYTQEYVFHSLSISLSALNITYTRVSQTGVHELTGCYFR